MADVSAVIERSGVGRFQVVVAALCGLAVMLDGYDVVVISYVAPAIARELGIERALLGPVFSAALLGTTLGAVIFASLADMIGRKPAISLCLVLFGICSLGTATASSLSQLLAWRFVGGLGLGGCAPIAVALLSEFCPAAHRGTFVIVMYCGYSVGAAGAGLVVAWLLGRFGWPSAFVVGGVLPLLLCVATSAWLPESISFLMKRGGREARIARILARIDPQLGSTSGGRFTLSEPPAAGLPVMALFEGRRGPTTILLWLMFFSNILSLYFMTTWFPTLINAAGVPLRISVLISTLIQVGSILGTLVLAALVNRRAPFPFLAVGFLLGAGTLALLSIAGASVPLLMVLAFFAGFLVIGTQTGANGVGALVYPPSIRSTGIGWALGIGRIGSILGPAIGGALVTLQWPIARLFLLAAIPAAIAGCLALAIAARLRREPAGAGA